MKLSPEEVELFYKLNSALLVYVNRQTQAVRGVETVEAFQRASLEDRFTIREMLYERPELIDSFVAENPEGFTDEELAEVRSWKHFVRGDFFAVRFLKRYAVFLDSGSPARAYGVLGLYDEIKDLFPQFRPPIYLHTVLLPFRKRIIYDGLVQAYSIHFGPGMRGNMNETYQAIRERGGIIESLDGADGGQAAGAALGAFTRQAGRRSKPAPELLPILERIVKEAESLRGVERVVERKAIAVLRAAAQLGRAAVAADPAEVDRALGRTRRALTDLERTLDPQEQGL